MRQRLIRCVVCGSPLGFPAGALCPDADQTAAQCVGCLARQVGDEGCLAFRLRRTGAGHLGRVTVSRAAAGVLAASGLSVVELLGQHAALRGAGKVVSLHEARQGRLLCAVSHVVGGELATALLLTPERG